MSSPEAARSGPLEWKPDRESRAPPKLGFKRQCPAMLLDNRTRDSESQPRAAAHGLRREKWVEYSGLDLGRNSGSGVLNRDDNVIAFGPRSDDDLAAAVRPRNDIGDGMPRVDDKVEEHLVQLARMANNRPQLGKIRLDVGDVFVLSTTHDEGALEALIQIGGNLFVSVWLAEFLDRPYDLGDAANSFCGALEGLGYGVFQIG